MEGEERQPASEEAVLPSGLDNLRVGDILCDRHRRDCYRVDGVDHTGVTLHQDGTDFHIPCSLFVSWHGHRLFSIEESRSIEPPDWCHRRSKPEPKIGDKN